MKTITEIRNWLLENAVDYDGDLMLSNLDFSDFDGSIYIDNMKVKNSLQQSDQTVGHNLCQSDQTVKGDLFQYDQTVKGDLFQSRQTVSGDLYNENNKYGGELHETPSTKLLKEVTLEELAELGYKLKENKQWQTLKK